MARKKKSDYGQLYEVTASYEGFWASPEHPSRGFRIYHLLVALNGEFGTTNEALEFARGLEPIVGPIPHFDSPVEEKKALCYYEFRDRWPEEDPAHLGVLTSRLRRTDEGWQIDLWCLYELASWKTINSLQNSVLAKD